MIADMIVETHYLCSIIRFEGEQQHIFDMSILRELQLSSGDFIFDTLSRRYSSEELHQP